MTDDFGTLVHEWLEQQQAYWAQLSGNDHPEGSPTSWQQFFSDHTKPGAQENRAQQDRLAALVTSQTLALNSYGEQLLSALRQSSSANTLNDATQQWLLALQQHATADAMQRWKLPDALAALLSPPGYNTNPFDSVAIENIRRLFAAAGASPDSDPALHAHQGMQLLLEYQQALQQYLAQTGLICQKASVSLAKALDEAETPVSSMTTLHALWVDHYELAYGQSAFSAAYQDAHGRISNAQMRLQQFAQTLRDAQSTRVGLATQQDLQRMRKDAHQLRKQVRRLQQELSSRHSPEPATGSNDDVAALRKEVGEMRSVLKQHQQAIQATPESDSTACENVQVPGDIGTLRATVRQPQPARRAGNRKRQT